MLLTILRERISQSIMNKREYTHNSRTPVKIDYLLSGQYQNSNLSNSINGKKHEERRKRIFRGYNNVKDIFSSVATVLFKNLHPNAHRKI